ncbi:MAG: hypothetical protein F4X36_06250 [Gammaproteobacteria bacterium]|nr:hypothetical protein [Gammaproteobacteria bacterium]
MAATGTALSASLDSRTALDDAGFLTVRKAARLLQRVLKTASTTLRGVVLLARAEDVAATETDTTRVTTVANVKALIARIGDATARAAAAAARTAADAALPKAGGTMTGDLTLSGAPTADLHAASKQYVDDNAGGDLSGVETEIDQLQHVTRDLHAVVEPGTWETADDGVLIASTPDTSGYDSTAFGSATAMVTNTAASNNNTPVSVSIRLPAGADVSQYRLINDLGLVTPGNSWQNRNLGVSPADSAHDYYKRVFVLGEREVSYDWTLQKRSADIDETFYDGEMRGTFAEDLIPLAALAPAVRTAIAAGGGAVNDNFLGRSFESVISPDLSALALPFDGGRTSVQMPDDGSYDLTLVDAMAITGKIAAGQPFVTNWFGVLSIGVHANRHIRAVMETTHSFNGKTLVHRRSLGIVRALTNSVFAIDLNRADSYSTVEVGDYMDAQGNTVTVTEADLQGPTTITYKLKLDCYRNDNPTTRQSVNVIYQQFEGVRVVSYQLGVVGGPILWPGISDQRIVWPGV